MERQELQYRVGGLLYSPAIYENLYQRLEAKEFPCLSSIAFCLEDSILDDALAAAETALVRTLEGICQSVMPKAERPLIFVRIRTPEHMRHVHALLGACSDALTGYILPKFDLGNCDRYRELICEINRNRESPLYIMPILESGMIANVQTRSSVLTQLKAKMDEMRDYVLNVRVGGNDFSNLYGLRRSAEQNIYQIGVIRDILVDIINVFAADYVISGPVWEYFGTDESAQWARGLRAELALDRLNGFIGKTCIHPSQLPLVYDSLKVEKSDYEDALSILGWNPNALGVAKSADGSRMNEVKCHTRWAKRIAILGEIYGIKERTEN